jgi:predicted nucleic acid-binding protein
VAVAGWILDKSAASRVADRGIRRELAQLAGLLFVCPISELEQLYSARSAAEYDEWKANLHADFGILPVPSDILDRALGLQRDLAHYHAMWHRIPIPDLLIAETALHHGMGVVTVDADFDRIAEVRPLIVRRLKT